MRLFNFKPARSMSEPPNEMVADLDALISKTFTVRLLGRDRKVKPISTEVFFGVTAALSKLSALNGKTDFKQKELVQAYYDVFQTVVDPISWADIEAMTSAQCAALLQVIIDSVSGKIYAANEKKKTLMPPPIQ
jgi:hypothetical protein